MTQGDGMNCACAADAAVTTEAAAATAVMMNLRILVLSKLRKGIPDTTAVADLPGRCSASPAPIRDAVSADLFGHLAETKILRLRCPIGAG
jgi:hypothetical protein